MNNLNVVTIYSDGGCRGNGKDNNIGAFAYVICYDKGFNSNNVVEFSKAFQNTTNNKMELLGVISALEALEYPSIVTVYSDSKYVCDAINNGWITNWKKNGWITKKKEPVKNQDLWIRLDALTDKHHCKFSWVKGHSDNVLNNRCDELLNLSMDNFCIDVDTVNDVNISIDVYTNDVDIVKHVDKGNDVVDSVCKVEVDADILKRLIAVKRELNSIISSLSI